MSTPTASLLIEVKDLPLADVHRLFHPESGMRIQPSAKPSQELQPSESRMVADLRAQLEAMTERLQILQRSNAKFREQSAEQPTWDGEAPTSTVGAHILEEAPQDLLNLSVFLEKLSDDQLDTVWVAALLDALRETLPRPSIRGLTLCLNHVRDRYRNRLTGAPVRPINIGGADTNIDNVRARLRAPAVPRAELVAQMLAAMPNIGDRAQSTHWDQQFRQRVKDIAMVDDRFNWIAGEHAGGAPTPWTLERIA